MTEEQEDLFGFEREIKIIESHARDVFTPTKPINSIDLFFERQEEVRRLIRQLSTPGQHSLLYGERGVGKSSLANVASQLLLSKLLQAMGGEVYRVSCDSSSTFELILCNPLKDAGVDITLREVDSKDTKGGMAKGKATVGQKLLGALGVEGQINIEKETMKVHEGPGMYITPSYAAEVLEKHKGLLVIDEADRLSRQIDKRRLAEFIKQLSDRDAKFKVLAPR